MSDVVIVGAKRTAIGSFLGQFTGVATPVLGTAAITGALEHAGVAPDQVVSDQARAKALLRSRRGKSPRGPTAHQPTGRSPSNASTPDARPDWTSERKASRLGDPLAASHALPPIGTRHHMHQHPPQAPLTPNSASITGQSSRVSGRVVRGSPGIAKAYARPPL